jgi:hypothetical protein
LMTLVLEDFKEQSTSGRDFRGRVLYRAVSQVLKFPEQTPEGLAESGGASAGLAAAIAVLSAATAGLSAGAADHPAAIAALSAEAAALGGGVAGLGSGAAGLGGTVAGPGSVDGAQLNAVN